MLSYEKWAVHITLKIIHWIQNRKEKLEFIWFECPKCTESFLVTGSFKTDLYQKVPKIRVNLKLYTGWTISIWSIFFVGTFWDDTFCTCPLLRNTRYIFLCGKNGQIKTFEMNIIEMSCKNIHCISDDIEEKNNFFSTCTQMTSVTCHTHKHTKEMLLKFEWMWMVWCMLFRLQQFSSIDANCAIPFKCLVEKLAISKWQMTKII